MREEEIITMLKKYGKGECTAEEASFIEHWYNRTAKENAGNPYRESVFMENAAGLDLILVQHNANNLSVVKKLKGRVFSLSVRTVAAVAAMVTIVFGVWFFSAQYMKGRQIGGRHPEFISGSQYDIEPGSNRATLTLANGKVISLSDAKTGVIVGEELRYNDGSSVANLSPSGRDAKGREGNNSGNPLSPQGGSLPEGERSRVQTLIASTPRGGTYQVTLPDGTRVWLNADSKISFPSQFSGKERKILLSGEAYFEVAKLIRLSPSGKDGRRPERVPFIVESKGQEVEVLGTHFNINSYSDEATVKTTLLEGSVRVAFLSSSASGSSLPRGEMALAREGNTSLPGGERSILLKPNQQAINNGNVINVKQVDPELAIAWKNKQFLFESEQIQTIMRMVERWYNVEVIYSGGITKDTFSGGVSRFDNLSEVLKSLESTGKIHFRIEGRKVYVTE